MRITVPLLPTEAYNTHIQVFHNDLPVANCRAAGGLESCTVAIPDRLDPADCLILVNLIDNFGSCIGPIYQLIDGVLSPYDPNAPQQADWSDEMGEEPEKTETRVLTDPEEIAEFKSRMGEKPDKTNIRIREILTDPKDSEEFKSNFPRVLPVEAYENESGSTLDVSSENTVGAELSDKIVQDEGTTLSITDEALGYVDSEDDVNG